MPYDCWMGNNVSVYIEVGKRKTDGWRYVVTEDDGLSGWFNSVKTNHGASHRERDAEMSQEQVRACDDQNQFDLALCLIHFQCLVPAP